MDMAGAGDVARAASAGANGAQRLLHRGQYCRVLSHAEIVVRAPHGDLGADSMIIGPRKAAAAPLEIGKDTVPPFGAQRIEPLFKEALVIHVKEALVIHDHCATGPAGTLRSLTANSKTRRDRPSVGR